MKDLMDKRKKELEEWAIKSRREEEERRKRISEAFRHDNKKKYIWMYESGPCDHWDGWSDLLNAGYIFNHRKMLSHDDGMYSEHSLSNLELLLIQSLAKFGGFFCNDWRGEHLKFIEVGSHMVLAGKCDTNGICYAFSSSWIDPDLIRHDNDRWKLIDCRKINELYGNAV